MACGCNKRKISGMKKGKFNMETLAKVAAGGLVGLALNAAIKKATASMPNKEMIEKAVPLAKAAAGFLMTKQKGNLLPYMGLGMIAEGAVEAALVLAPDIFDINVSGFGDVYTSIGNPYEYDALPGGSINSYMYDDTTEGDELIAGTDSESLTI